jgi:predicted DCC family thiol-disulfide oxidoreductase YuxK
MSGPAPSPIVLYDGICALCNRFVQFVLKRDSQDRFRFASLQSNFASQLLRLHNTAPQDIDTMYLVLDHGLPSERLLSRSAAAVTVLQELGGGWKPLAGMLQAMPAGMRDWAYNLVARNRYRTFGKYDSCPIPNAKDRRKFLDLP